MMCSGPLRRGVGCSEGLGQGFGRHAQGLLPLLGAHDFVVIAERNSDKSVAQFILTLASLGNVRTTTIHAFTEAQFKKIVGALK